MDLEIEELKRKVDMRDDLIASLVALLDSEGLGRYAGAAVRDTERLFGQEFDRTFGE